MDAIIDTHAHLMFDDFKGDLEAVLERAQTAGVQKILNVGCGVDSSKQAIEMAEKYPMLYASVGIHPYDAPQATEALMAEWEVLIKENDKIVAVGECGLDYAKSKASKEDQKMAFKLQLQLAKKVGLPVIIHNRDADEDCLAILDEVSNDETIAGQIYAVFHCFSSNVEFARKVWYRGHMTSFTGTITFTNAEKVVEVVNDAPMDLFLVETDCPYLAPQDQRGKRNEPAFVVDVVKKIAEVKEMHFDDVARASISNALSLFLRMGRS